jgi:hypothetical protein
MTVHYGQSQALKDLLQIGASLEDQVPIGKRNPNWTGYAWLAKEFKGLTTLKLAKSPFSSEDLLDNLTIDDRQSIVEYRVLDGDTFPTKRSRNVPITIIRVYDDLRLGRR